MHPAAFIRPLLITIAPSCKGLFLKNIFSIRRWLISALIISPVRTTSSKGKLCSITIKAPTFCLPILIHAITTGMISSCCMLSFLFPVKKRTKALACWCEPSVSKKRRISSWKRIISATTPTLTNLSKMEPSSFISNTCDTTNQINMNIRIPVNTLMEPEAFISLYV